MGSGGVNIPSAVRLNTLVNAPGRQVKDIDALSHRYVGAK